MEEGKKMRKSEKEDEEAGKAQVERKKERQKKMSFSWWLQSCLAESVAGTAGP